MWLIDPTSEYIIVDICVKYVIVNISDKYITRGISPNIIIAYLVIIRVVISFIVGNSAKCVKINVRPDAKI
jgi:hypothetical protein